MDPSMQQPLNQQVYVEPSYGYNQPPPYYTSTPPQNIPNNTAYYPPQNGGYAVQQYPGTTETTTAVLTSDMGADLKKKNDDMAFMIFLIGFCFPIIWLVLFVMTRNRMNYSDRGRKFGNIGGILFLVFIILDIALVILIVALRVTVRYSY